MKGVTDPSPRIREGNLAVPTWIQWAIDVRFEAEALALRLGLAEIHFHQWFKAVAERSWPHWCRETRLWVAGFWLWDGHAIPTVWTSLGYSSETDFTTRFRQYHSCHPGHFRNILREFERREATQFHRSVPDGPMPDDIRPEPVVIRALQDLCLWSYAGLGEGGAGDSKQGFRSPCPS